MKPLTSVMLAGVLLGGVGFADRAEAADDRRRDERSRHAIERGHDDDRRYRDDRHDDYRYRDRGRHRHHDHYFREREVYVIREYYRPHHRTLPRGIAKKYYRTGYLPRGWAKRMRPVPVYVERELVVLPHGYHRGIIDGHAVIYHSRGMIIDVAVLF